jgi:surface-anchored protein
MRRFPTLSRGMFAATRAAGLAVALGMWAAVMSPAAATPFNYVAGHGDIGLSYDSPTDSLRIYLNFDFNSVVQDANGNQLTMTELNALQNPAGTAEWSMNDFRVVVPASQQFARESGANWDIVGVAAGEPYWELPDSGGLPGVPFFGFERRPVDLANATFTLGNVISAPAGGVISAWQYNNSLEPDLGPNRYWSTATGSTPSPNAITLDQGHQHYNFGFSKPGLYQFEIIGTTTEALGREAVGVLTVNVVPEPSGLVVLGGAAAWWLVRSRKKAIFGRGMARMGRGLTVPARDANLLHMHEPCNKHGRDHAPATAMKGPAMSLRQPASLLALLGILLLAAPQVQAANIVFQDEEGDLTFFYDSVANTWATVFRAKGTADQPTTTEATGLTAPFNGSSTPATWPGIVGNVVADPAGDTGDYTFTTLTTEVNTATTVALGAVNYLVSSAEGSPFLEGAGADLGIRMRLQENFTLENSEPDPNVNQFTGFNLTLNPAASTFNGGPLVGNANVSLINWDGSENPIAQIDTATNTLTANFGNYEHVHRNWGFSNYGDYSLVFDLVGVGGAYGDTAAVGTTTINFAVAVPEPGSVSLAALGLLGAAGGFRWLRRRHRVAAAANVPNQADA